MCNTESDSVIEKYREWHLSVKLLYTDGELLKKKK